MGPWRHSEAETSRVVSRNVITGSVVSRCLLCVCLLVSFLQSGFFALALVPDPEDTVHMFLGRLALSGEISLYQDDLPGHRAPLPYYFIGLSQFLRDRSVVVGRLWSAALGVLCFVLLLALTTRLAGELAGTLAVLFAVTQGLIVGYFAHTSYHSLVSFLLLTGLYVALCTNFRGTNVWAMGVFSLLFFTRTLTWPLIPLAMVYLLGRARGWFERAGIVAVTIIPPLVFFWSDPNHLKLLAFAPGVGRLVGSLGYRGSPMMMLASIQDPGLDTPARALGLFVRWYKIWILAGLTLTVVLVVRAVRQQSIRAMVSNRGVNLIGATLLYLAVWQFVAFPSSPTWAVGYLASFAILGAVGLGFGFSILLREFCVTTIQRRVVVTLLCCFLLFGPRLSRPPDLPVAVSEATAPVLALYRVSEALRMHIPPESRVFHLASFQPLYLAGFKLYLRQVFGAWTLSPITDENSRRKSGLWGEAEIHGWLDSDARYVVIDPANAAMYRSACEHCVELVSRLVAEHFTLVAVVDGYQDHSYRIYRRRT